MAIDALAGGLAFGAADAADVAAPLAVDVGADVGAGVAADVGATTGADIAASTVPDLTAADIGATTGVDLGASGANLAAADLGAADLGAGAAADVGTFGGAAAATDAAGLGDFFAGTSGDLLSGAGIGPGADVGAGTFGDAFAGTDAFGNPIGADTSIGSFGSGTAESGAPAAEGLDTGVGSTPPGVGPEETAISNQPLYSDSGIVDTGGGNQFQNDFSQFTTTDQGVSMPTDMASRVGAVPVSTESTSLEQAFPGASQAITGGDIPPTPASFSAPAGTDFSGTSMFNTGGVVPGTGIEAAPEDFTAGVTPGATQTTLTPGGFDTGIETATVGPSPQMVAGAPDYTLPGATAPATPGGAPITTSALAPAAATPATAATAASGVSPLTALRYGTAGVNAIAAGVNLSNALNQPSYPALQPAAYPGSIYSPYYSSMQPGVGGGGIAGGTAAARLTNGLVSGESPQQLAQSGIISPQRAATLQQTYTSIAQQYAQTLGVSPQSLSTGVQQMIAARALADMGLGGR